MEVVYLWRRSSFVLQQKISFRKRHYFYRQRVVLAGTQQLRLQGLVSEHVHCTEGVTRSDEREGANGDGTGAGIRDGDGDEAGTGTGP